MTSHVLTIGTRGSALALAQAGLACRALTAAVPDLKLRIQTIWTTGDELGDVPVSQLGRYGAFVSEIETALLAGEVDIAVHSTKDMPSLMPHGTRVAAYLPRADASDVLVAHGASLATLRPGSRLGTSSPRRLSMLRAKRADVIGIEMRGNVDSRLERFSAGAYDALILAAAGLTRLGHDSVISEWLDPNDFVPSPGQGAIALQVRVGDAVANDIVRRVNDVDTANAVAAERAFLAQSGAGCAGAVGAYARHLSDGNISIVGLLGDLQGRFVRECVTGPRADAEALGARLARSLIARAASERIDYREGEEFAGVGIA